MSRKNWAQEYSNNERVVFNKGNWSLTVDGEQSWTLYYMGQYVDTVVDYNNYRLLDKGFLLYRLDSHNHFSLYSENERSPIFTISGKDINFKTEDNFLTFYSPNNQISFDSNTLTKVFLTEENQIGIDF